MKSTQFTSTNGALVFASSYTALGIVRSLGRQHIPVWVLGDRTSVASGSRYSKRTVPILGKNETEQIEFLIKLARDHHLNGWALFPDSDKSVALIARNHKTLSEYYKLTSPAWREARWALDKKLTYQLAEELGLNYPKSYYPTSRSDVERIEGIFPMILKPAHHEGTDRFSIISGAWQANDRAELLALYDKANVAVANQPVITIQELIPGDNGQAQFSYAALCDQGRILASLCAQRKRLLPVDFGASTFVESVSEIPEIEDASRHWLEKVKYSGLVEVEFKLHAGTGQYNLLDVNIRSWGWHALSGFADVDFPFLMWKLVQNQEIKPIRGRSGIRWVRTAHDFMSAVQLIQRGTLSIKDYFESLRGAHHDVLLLDDLLPTVVEFPLLLRLVLNKLNGY